MTTNVKHPPQGAGIIGRRRIIQLCLVTGCAFLLNLAAFSPFFTPDSLHYLHLSLHPVAGEAHPLGFGFFLLLAKYCADVLRLDFLVLFSLFTISTTVIAITFYDALPNESTKRSPFAYLFFMLYLLLLLPALLIISSAVWSESLYWLILIFICGLLFLKPKRPALRCVLVLLIAVLCTFLYHVRYEGIIVIPALLSTAIIFLCRADKDTALKFLYAGITSVILIASSMILIHKTFPAVDINNKMLIDGLRTSMQCTLRCAHPLFENQCDQPGAYEPIKDASCSDITLGHVQIGAPLAGTLTFSGLLKEMGIKDTITWLFKAPWKYLQDIHTRWGMEIGRFDMRHPNLNASPYAGIILEYYKYFNYYLTGPSPLFNALHVWIKFLHFELKAYNWFSLFGILIALFFIVTSRQPLTVFFCFISIGTLLIFSYINPHVPFRFLIHILLPCFIGISLNKN